MSNAPTLLSISDQPVCSQKKATKHSKMLARVCGFDPDALELTTQMTLPNGRKTSPKEDMETIRRTGAGAAMQGLYDANNRLFNMNNILPIGFSTPPSSGLKMAVSAKSPILSEGRPSISMAQYHPLTQVIDDALHMRRMCVDHSSMALHCLPFYRSYLGLCISVVDCFVHYCSKYLQDMSESFTLSDYVNELLFFGTTQERKLEILWNVIFLNHNKKKDKYLTAIFAVPTEDVVIDQLKDGFSALKKSKNWQGYVELKNERNNIIHPSGHIASIYIENIISDLNKCRSIGQVLLEFARHQNYYGELGCLRRLAHAPLVKFA